MANPNSVPRPEGQHEEEANAVVHLKSSQEALHLFGHRDRWLKVLRELVNAKVIARGNTIRITGNLHEVTVAEQALRDLLTIVRQGGEIDRATIEQSVALAESGKSLTEETHAELSGLSLPRRLRPKTPGQRRYVEAIAQNDIVFGIGPAGTGKTYLAVAMAVAALKAKRVKRLILTRPAVEAGERLGFLPGDIQAKVDPYLRPLYDALFDMIDADRFDQYLASGIIEVAPLAFMRGRTLNDAFIILDEAQNTTPEQMKMFLTRMGFNSKVVVTGDITQIDLPKHTKSGLVEAQRTLKHIEGIRFIYFKDSDVVRHPLVARIIKAYERAEAEHAEG
ncbi:PhoH family protein [Marinithermus hydrothermalis]|uniref:PhoH-like protein n=1 Tax=Marinithermus hydrothermalis (strain DSM 14884 / JCM 11576 / T1) TaxID=869210 RepID=F2NP69_MARHT|nr:PhoH family protein [Marinithermus hydrothermalis]AEB11870.1 PhoH family protein [Marinithermus hydrothermalis DSM 14884]